MPHKPKDWDKLGVIAGIAGVLVAIAAIVYSQRERVYVSVTPTAWESVDFPKEPSEALIKYSITVTGQAPARNVQLKQYCRVGNVHILKKIGNKVVEIEDPSYETTFVANSFPPGTGEHTCMASPGKNEASLFVFVEGVVTYEDDFGTESTHFCFSAINLVGEKLHPLMECRADQLDAQTP